MARCPKKMRLNEYRNVDVPTERQLFSRFGDCKTRMSYTTSLEKATEAEPIPMGESKLTGVQRAVSYVMSIKDDQE